MLEICRFHGIIIAMYYNDHAPAHFHAKYTSNKARIAIATGEVIQGSLPRRALRLADEWRTLHEVELQAAWDDVTARQPVKPIEPLE